VVEIQTPSDVNDGDVFFGEELDDLLFEGFERGDFWSSPFFWKC
jgi:hypothetical protein